MKLQSMHLREFSFLLTTGQLRKGLILTLRDSQGNEGLGEVSPLPNWSSETLEDALLQLSQKKQDILSIDWTIDNCFENLTSLKLLPSVTFGLETALLQLLSPIQKCNVKKSALFMGSRSEILEHADLRLSEGFTSAKLKVGHLTFDVAFEVISALKDKFKLRIDVNRAWKTEESLKFFSQFSFNAFDYIEEPFQNPHDLIKFTHPLAVDESFPNDLSLQQLELLPTLKAIIYKPTIQGGMTGCLKLHEFTMKCGISLVLSSSFESELGLNAIASISHRLRLDPPIGIGTYHYLAVTN